MATRAHPTNPFLDGNAEAAANTPPRRSTEAHGSIDAADVDTLSASLSNASISRSNSTAATSNRTDPPALPRRRSPSGTDTRPPPTRRNRSSMSMSTSALPPSSSNVYPEPTTVPTPGRPLLRDGNVLVMPPTWEDCSKCHGMGWMHADPEHPCDACWRSFGRRYVPGLATSPAIVDNAMILQKPLPSSSRPAARYAAPSHPPPPPSAMQQQQRRMGPPQVNRAQDANEANDDPDGEAPPAYEDVVRVPHGMPLPPQRTGAGSAASGGGWSGTVAPSTAASAIPHSHPPLHRPPPQSPPSNFHSPPGGYPGAVWHHQQHQQQQYQQQYPHHHQPPFHHHYRPPLPPQPNSHFYVSSTSPFSAPPPGALVVSPGDPRIGGRLCNRCGGRGTRDSLFWGTETCSHCYGAGRVT